MTELCAEHGEREQDAAQRPARRGVPQELARKEEQEHGADGAGKDGIGNQADIATGRDEVVCQINKFRDDNDVLIVMAKQHYWIEHNTVFCDQACDVTPVIVIGEDRPGRRRAAEREACANGKRDSGGNKGGQLRSLQDDSVPSAPSQNAQSHRTIHL